MGTGPDSPATATQVGAVGTRPGLWDVSVQVPGQQHWIMWQPAVALLSLHMLLWRRQPGLVTGQGSGQACYILPL
jgi:hypothetical protein